MVAITTHVGDISGCGEPDLLLKVRRSLGHRLGKMKSQETSIVRARAELAQEDEFSVTWTREDLTKKLKLPHACPKL